MLTYMILKSFMLLVAYMLAYMRAYMLASMLAYMLAYLQVYTIAYMAVYGRTYDTMYVLYMLPFMEVLNNQIKFFKYVTNGRCIQYT